MSSSDGVPDAGGCRVMIVGAGNIGSHAVSLVARDGRVSEEVVVDLDVYEERNLINQEIGPGDVGANKAIVAAGRAAAIRPGLRARGIAARVEALPTAEIGRCDFVLGCLDSLAARQYLGEIAWRLGVPYIDAGVRPDGLLARVSHYRPAGDDAPCIECLWSDATYRNIARVAPCAPAGERPSPTGGPAALGALAASLQVIALIKLIECSPGALPPGGELVYDARHDGVRVSRNIRQRACRFDHAHPEVVWLGADPGSTTLADILDAALARCGGRVPGCGEISLSLLGRQLATRWSCSACGATLSRLGAWNPHVRAAAACAACGRAACRPVGFHALDALSPGEIAPGDLGRSVAEMGIDPGEIFSVTFSGRSIQLSMGTARVASSPGERA